MNSCALVSCSDVSSSNKMRQGLAAKGSLRQFTCLEMYHQSYSSQNNCSTIDWQSSKTAKLTVQEGHIHIAWPHVDFKAE